MVNNLNYLNISKGMAIAALEALKSNPFPNPKVGAALFDKNMKLKNKSYHVQKGLDHAEVSLIKEAKLEDSDYLYVTLEPCYHDDTSPSCAKELINTNIKNVIIGDVDVDSRTAGKSIELLSENGINIKVETGINDLLNPYYENVSKSSSITYIGKIGISSNNYIYDSESKNKYITNDISLDISHILRATVDAILIGKNTFIIDNPILNIRNSELKDTADNPLKIVWWGSKVPNEIKKNDKLNQYLFIESSSLQELENTLIENNCRSLLVEGGKYIHELLFAHNKYLKFYEFRSKNFINKGLSMDYLSQSVFNEAYKEENKFLLKDNELVIYTRK